MPTNANDDGHIKNGWAPENKTMSRLQWTWGPVPVLKQRQQKKKKIKLLSSVYSVVKIRQIFLIVITYQLYWKATI